MVVLYTKVTNDAVSILLGSWSRGVRVIVPGLMSAKPWRSKAQDDGSVRSLTQK